MFMLRTLLSLLLTFSLLLLQSCSSGTVAVSTAAVPSQWIVAWGASMQNASASSKNPGGSEQSFRFMVYPTIAGAKERVHFSNYFGTTPVTIGAARLSVASNGDDTAAVDPARDMGLTFNGGSKSVTLQANQEIDSDPVQIPYYHGEWLAVSVYLKGKFSPLTQHDAGFSNSYTSVVNAGDVTADTSGTSFTATNTEWLLVSAVEAYGPYQGTVAFFGSSSVDGHNSNLGNSNAYPVGQNAIAGQITSRPSDLLAQSLLGAGYNFGVVNAAFSGDAAGEDANSKSGNVTAGVDRFNHDVLQLPGIAAVVIYIGGIDLRVDCLPATTVEGTVSNIIAQAAAAKVRVILATLPPAEYCLTGQPVPTTALPYNGDIYPGPENPGSTQRRAFNDWVRTTAVNLPGVVAIADFDKALAYPTHPDFMIPNLNSGDNFHPDGAGYMVQNGAIPLSAVAGH